MIRSFGSGKTKRVFEGGFVKSLSADLPDRAEMKLRVLNRARTLDDLRSFPGNRLEKLVGKRKGQSSIRVNNQWRICFRWKKGDAYEVEIVDYH